MSLIVSYDDVDAMGADAGGGMIFYYQGQPLTGYMQEYINGVLIGESEFTDGHKGEYKGFIILMEKFRKNILFVSTK